MTNDRARKRTWSNIESSVDRLQNMPPVLLDVLSQELGLTDPVFAIDLNRAPAVAEDVVEVPGPSSHAGEEGLRCRNQSQQFDVSRQFQQKI